MNFKNLVFKRATQRQVSTLAVACLPHSIMLYSPRREMKIVEPLRIAVSSLLILLIITGSVFAQSGSRAGINDPASAQELTELSPQVAQSYICLLYTSPSPRDLSTSRMPSSA